MSKSTDKSLEKKLNAESNETASSLSLNLEETNALPQQVAQAVQADQKVAEEAVRKEILELINPGSYYNHYALNAVIEHNIVGNDQIRFIRLGEDQNLIENLVEFREGQQRDLIMPLHLQDSQYFAGFYIRRREDRQYIIYHIDPLGANIARGIPQNITNGLRKTLGVEENNIIRTENIIQPYNWNIETIDINNVHCGAFTGFILSELVVGNLRIVERRLQINVNNNWQDLPDLNTLQSNTLGIAIRERDCQSLGGEKMANNPMQVLIDLISQNSEENEGDKEENSGLKRYELKRSNSGMTNYTDLIDEILRDQDINDLSSDDNQEYEIKTIKPLNSQKQLIEKQIKDEKTKIKKKPENKLLKEPTKTSEQKNAKQHRHNKKLYKNSPKIQDLQKNLKSIPLDQEVDLKTEELKGKKIHLFRGKCLNSTTIDNKTGKKRSRTKKENQEYITKKYEGKTLYSDGAFNVKNDQEKIQDVEEKTRKYLQDIKIGQENMAVFNAGKAYDAGVAKLMKKTETKGNTLVATSKLSWTASEYISGQMGGAAGGDRKVCCGYAKNKKPVNRIMGNGFVISLTVEKYKDLREKGDLIDVNVDLGTKFKPNKVIEEVTFNTKIEGKMVRGSLPMVLPRLDRNYEEMSVRKRDQYKKIFGLDKTIYNSLQSQLGKNVAIGAITEHLILHHGNLLRKIAVKSDRRNGYEGKFIATKNESCHGYLDDLNNSGYRLSCRPKRKKDAKAQSGYLEDNVSAVNISSQDQELNQKQAQKNVLEDSNEVDSNPPNDLDSIMKKLKIDDHKSEVTTLINETLQQKQQENYENNQINPNSTTNVLLLLNKKNPIKKKLNEQ